MAVNLFQLSGVYQRLIFARDVPRIDSLCHLCDGRLAAEDVFICRGCVLDLPFIRQACPICALPGPTAAVCGSCLNSKRLYVDHAISLFRYEYPASRLVMDFKYHARLPLAVFFARLLVAAAATTEIEMPDLFLPVPLHRTRLATRGFNQAQEICRQLCALTGIPGNHRQCRRIRPTPMQSGLSARARRRNLKAAFAVDLNTPLPAHVAIVDDVVTTGSTVNELARTLARAGVRRIDVWSCCRAV